MPEVSSAQSTPWASAKSILSQHCIACHGSDQPEAGLNFEELLESSSFDDDSIDHWVQIESMIRSREMPPESEQALSDDELASFNEWFDLTLVQPKGKRRLHVVGPRRLTREELQNTLEDLLRVPLRATVTNSRLHVIPETTIEKFFAAGVIGPSGFSNDASTLYAQPIDVETLARCFSTVLRRAGAHQKASKHLFGDQPVEELSDTELSERIERLATLAFRRPVTSDESRALQAVFQKMRPKSSTTEALRSSLLAALLSPSFLYRFEEPTDGGPVPVSADELASRLSYFLWSAPPDDTLRQLARNGSLLDEKVLIQQVRRMLADPKRIALSENLGGEWFGYKPLRRHSAINRRSDKMAGFYRTQYEEALLFFDSIIRFRHSLLHLIDADWGYLNPHQRNIYKMQTGTKQFDEATALPPINLHYRSADREIHNLNYEYKHTNVSLVGLTDPDRGGFLTMGPTLSATSTPNRTSPIRRGVWVLERILGKHFKQPENVPDLESTQKKAKQQKLKLTQEELLKLHSSQEGCASCHRYIDPIGFGLEVYDQLGIRRSPNPQLVGGEELSWSPKITPASFADRSWTLQKPLKPGTQVRVLFQYTRGRHRLDIRNVRLASGSISLVDGHHGFTGEATKENIWVFNLPEKAPGEGWTLTAEVHGDGGSDSHGTIRVAGPGDQGPGYQLPGGLTFRSPAELKQLLLSDYREEIIDNAIRRVLAYALGRRILPLDRPTIQEIRQTIEPQDYRLNALIEAVVLSYPFRHKDSFQY